MHIKRLKDAYEKMKRRIAKNETTASNFIDLNETKHPIFLNFNETTQLFFGFFS